MKKIISIFSFFLISQILIGQKVLDAPFIMSKLAIYQPYIEKYNSALSDAFYYNNQKISFYNYLNLLARGTGFYNLAQEYS